MLASTKLVSNVGFEIFEVEIENFRERQQIQNKMVHTFLYSSCSFCEKTAIEEDSQYYLVANFASLSLGWHAIGQGANFFPHTIFFASKSESVLLFRAPTAEFLHQILFRLLEFLHS